MVVQFPSSKGNTQEAVFFLCSQSYHTPFFKVGQVNLDLAVSNPYQAGISEGSFAAYANDVSVTRSVGSRGGQC